MEQKHSHFWDKALVAAYFLWAIILPWSLAGMQIGLGLTVLVTIFIIVKQKQTLLIFHPFTLFLVAYLLVRLLSALFSPQPMVSLNAVFHTDWPLLSLPVLLSAPLFPRARKKILKVLLYSAAVLAIYAIYQFFSGTDIYRGRALAPMGHFFRATGAYDHYLTLAGNQLMIFFVGLGLIKAEISSKRKMLLTLSSVLVLLSVLATFGRSAWIAAALVGGIGLIFTGRKILRTAAVLLLVGIITLVLTIPEIQDRLLSSFELSQNADRLNLWKTSLAMVSDKPLLGIGPGLFGEFFNAYKVPGTYGATGHPHNDYLNLAATSGILGLLAWLLMWGYWFFYTVRAYRSSPLRSADRQLLSGIILSLAGILVAAFFQCYYTDLENNLCWCFLAALGLQAAVMAGSSPEAGHS
jgi:putative inorganic carbon (HCO3(-)) transporter